MARDDNNEAPRSMMVRRRREPAPYPLRGLRDLESPQEVAASKIWRALIWAYYRQYPDPEQFATAAFRRAIERHDHGTVFQMGTTWVESIRNIDENSQKQGDALLFVIGLYKGRDRIVPCLPSTRNNGIRRAWHHMEPLPQAAERILVELDRKRVGKTEMNYAVQKFVEVGLIANAETGEAVLQAARDKAAAKKEPAAEAAPAQVPQPAKPAIAKIGDLQEARKAAGKERKRGGRPLSPKAAEAAEDAHRARPHRQTPDD